MGKMSIVGRYRAGCTPLIVQLARFKVRIVHKQGQYHLVFISKYLKNVLYERLWREWTLLLRELKRQKENGYSNGA